MQSRGAGDNLNKLQTSYHIEQMMQFELPAVLVVANARHLVRLQEELLQRRASAAARLYTNFLLLILNLRTNGRKGNSSALQTLRTV